MESLNEKKANEIATRWKAKGLPYNAIYDTALEAMQWKDEQFAQEKKEIDEQWKRLMVESKSIGVDLMQHKEKQMLSRAKTFIKEIARVCDITDENGYRVDERYLLGEFEKSIKEEL